MTRQDVTHERSRETHTPMRIESVLFLGLVAFFLPVTLLYGFWSGWEPVGSTVLGLLVGLWGLTGGYLWLVSRRVDARPEDDPLAEVDEGAGEYGVFSPWSWWPLVLGIAAALVFLGLALGWWISGIGVAIGIIGLIGQILEFSRGQHAH